MKNQLQKALDNVEHLKSGTEFSRRDVANRPKLILAEVFMKK